MYMKTPAILAAFVIAYCRAIATEPLPPPPYYATNAKIRTLYDTHVAQCSEIDALRARVAELEAAPAAPSAFEAEVLTKLEDVLNNQALTAVATVPNTRFTLTWTDNSTNEAGFRVERSTNGGPWVEIGTTAANVATYVDSGLAPGTYSYRVRAFNQAGASAFSNTATGTL